MAAIRPLNTLLTYTNIFQLYPLLTPATMRLYITTLPPLTYV